MKILIDGNEWGDFPNMEMARELAAQSDLGLDAANVEIVLTTREQADARASAGEVVTRAMHNAGMPQSALIGLLSDIGQYGAFTNAVTVVALGKHGNAAQKAFIAEMKALEPAEMFLAAVQGEMIKIPALEKGIDVVMEELRLSVDAYLAAKSAIEARGG